MLLLRLMLVLKWAYRCTNFPRLNAILLVITIYHITRIVSLYAAVFTLCIICVSLRHMKGIIYLLFQGKSHPLNSPQKSMLNKAYVCNKYEGWWYVFMFQLNFSFCLFVSSVKCIGGISIQNSFPILLQFYIELSCVMENTLVL